MIKKTKKCAIFLQEKLVFFEKRGMLYVDFFL